MKKFTTFFIAISAITLMAFTIGDEGKKTEPMGQGDELVDCLIKCKPSAWGEPCSQCVSSSETFVVFYKNTCTKKLDVVIGVQEESKNWRLSKFLGVAANDTIRAYACKGTGKTKKWAREAGDTSNKIPTAEEFDKL